MVDVLKDSAIVQLLPMSVEPSGLNMTRNMTNSGEESIPIAYTTAYDGTGIGMSNEATVSGGD